MTQSLISETRRTSLGWMIQRIAARLDRDMAAALAPLGLTQLQFAILMTVLEREGLNQAQIGKLFSQPPYAISRALDRLEQNGLVVRAEDATSRRAVRIRATDAGAALAPELRQIVQQVNAALTEKLTDQEGVQAAQILSKMLPITDRTL